MASILIIESDSTARQLLVEFVIGLGHQAIGPKDVASGSGPNLVLLEPANPAALGEVQSLREQYPEVPIVCVSNAHPSDAVKELEPSSYLMKPFRGRLLEWAIAEALDAALILAAA